MNYNMTYNMNLHNTQPSVYNPLPNQNYFNASDITNESIHESRNRFVYINQNFVNSCGAKNTKVLINPNFKKTVHINPNFKNSIKNSIHVNPSILKIAETSPVIQTNQNNFKDNIIATRTEPIISTRTKLVRLTNAEDAHYGQSKCERRKSLHTKYKIVHNTENISRIDSGLSKNYLRNRYKIDKNIIKIKKSPKGTRSRYCLQNTFVNASKKANSVKKTKQNSKYISINGTLYKKTPNVLKKADLVKITCGKSNINKSKVLVARDKLYKLDHNQKRLKVIPITKSQKVCKSRNTYNRVLKQKKINVSMKLSRSKRKIIVSDIKTTSKCILVSQMRKCNMPCPIYRKFGKCKAKELGRCIRVHNPNQVMMCTKFLQGDCFDSNCLLSHKVSAEKMPTCKYYLDGLCTREDCVYLHVKISTKADICKDFLEGFCKKAKECDKRHQILCPDYEKHGSCPRKRCQYPHGNVVRNRNILSKVAKRIVTMKSNSAPAVKAKFVKNGNDEQLDKYLRYYKENEEIESKDIIEDNLDSHNDVDGIDNVKYLNLLKRAQVGVLPSYIPLGHEAVNSIENDVKV